MTAQAIIPQDTMYSMDQRGPSLGVFGLTDEIHIGYISEVVNYINQHFSEDMSLDEITRKAFLSKFHFSRIFKKHTSYSPYQYLIMVRLNHSRQLLLHSNYSIKEVADKCGFKRLDYFSSMFKKRFKCNPTQYRESYAMPYDRQHFPLPLM
jgi:AraC-like DNA-binding protein